jgi:hypothetical protein
MNTKQVDKLHYEAMRSVDQSNHLRRLGDAKGSKQRLRQAFLKERRVAQMLADKIDFEPSRSVLHRSAATLALQCGELREAERLIGAALSGDPPEVIAEELRDLLEQVYFEKPLRRERRNISKAAQMA